MAYFGHVLTLKDRFSQTFSRWEGQARRMQGTGESLTRANVGLAASFGALAAAGTVALAKMVSSFASVEARLKELQVVTTTTFQNVDQAMAQSLERARQFSGGFVFSMEEIVGASFELASAGLNVEETIAGIEQASFLAAAGLGDLRETAILMGSAFNTVGKAAELQFLDPMEKAKKIADSTALAVKKFQITLPVLQEGLKFTVGPASQLGVSLDELNATLGVLNTLGLRASIAGTVLSNIFAKLSTGVDKLGLDTTKFLDSAGNLTSIADFLDEVRAALPTSSFERFSKLIEVFGIRAARGVVALLDNVEALREHTRELNNSEGAAEQFGQTVASSLQGRLKVLRNNVDNLFSVLGQKLTPAVKTIVDGLSSFFGKLQEVAKSMGRFGVAITIVVTAFSALIAVVAAAKLAIALLSALHIGAALSALKHAFGIAAIQAAYGNFVAVAAVVAVVALATAVTFAAIGEEAQSTAEVLNHANTEFEGINSTMARVTASAGKLQRVVEGGFDFNLGDKEVLAFADLIDFGDRRGLDRELRGVLEQQRQLEVFVDLSFREGRFKALEQFPDQARKTFAQVQREIRELEDRAAEIKLEMDTSGVLESAGDVARLKAQIILLDEEGLGRLQLRAFAEQMSLAQGATVQADEVFAQVTARLRAMGLGLEKVGVFLGVFAGERDKAFRASGISVGIKEVENFRANVARTRTELERLAAKADAKPAIDALTISESQAGVIRSQFDFVTRKLTEIEKFDPQFAQRFREQLAAVDGSVQTAAGTFADLNRIVERGSEGLEDQGKVEFFRDDTARDTSAVFAKLALELDRKFGAALTAATEKANELSGALTLKAIIQTDLVAPIGQFAERIKQVEKNAQALGRAFDPGTLAEQDKLLKAQLERIRSASAEQAKLVRILEDKLGRVGADVQAKARINRELGEALKLQTSLAEQTEATRRKAEQTRERFAAIAQARFPDLARQLGIERGAAFKLSFEVEADVRGEFDRVRQGLDAELRQLRSRQIVLEFDASQARLGIGDKTKSEAEAALAAINRRIDAARRRLSGLPAEMEVRIREETLKTADQRFRRAVEELRRAGQVPIRILETKQEFEFLTKAVGEALEAGLKTGRFEDFTAALSRNMREQLIKGIVSGLTEGFLIGFAVGDLKAIGTKIGQALARGGPEGRKAIEAELRQLEANVGRINLGKIGGDQEASQVFSRLVGIVGQLDQQFTRASRGALEFKAVADTAAKGLDRDLASLTTRLQLATGAEREFIRQIIALKEGRGAVAGVAIETATVEQRLGAALALLRQMREARVTGAPVQELTKILDDLNLKLRQGGQQAAALGQSVQQAARPAVAAPRPVAAAAGPAPGGLIDLEARLQGARRAAEELRQLTIAPQVDVGPVNRLREAFAAIEDREVRLDVAVIGRDEVAEVIELLGSDIGLAGQLSDANDEITALKAQAQEVVDILASARIGLGGRIEVGASAAPERVTVNTGDTAFTISATGGITGEQRDEILRRVAEALDDKLEEIRQQLDALVLAPI